MIYSLNEARTVEEYKAEKAAREKAEQDKKDKQYNDRYYGKNKDADVFVRKTRPDGHEDTYVAYGVGNHNRINMSGFHYLNSSDRFRGRDADRVADRNAKSTRERHEISDAVNRNMRRHPERWDGNKPVKPKSESTIFDNIEIV